MTRDEHVEWCKERALEYVEMGDFTQAITSMASDLTKHEETKNHKGIDIGVMMLVGGMLRTKEDVVRFINGFH
jgi:hypothetical protein